MKASKTGHAGKFFPDPTPALIRARKTAEKIAAQTGTAIVVVRGGKVVRLRLKPRTRGKRA